MKLTLFQPIDQPIIDKWLSDQSLFNLIYFEEPNTTLPIYLYIIRKDDDKPVGFVVLFNIDWKNRRTEAGIAIPEKEGRGLSHAVGRMVLSQVFDMGFNRVTVRVLEKNRITRKLAQLFGFTLEGRERKAAYQDGEYQDIFVFGLLKDEFAKE